MKASRNRSWFFLWCWAFVCLPGSTGVGASVSRSSGGRARFYVVFFGFQDRGGPLAKLGHPAGGRLEMHRPEKSHTAAAFLRVEDLPDGRRKIEHVDLSWYPPHFWKDRRVELPRREEGGDAESLSRTLQFASEDQLETSHYGPFPIDEVTYRAAETQLAFLKSGMVDYQAMDAANRWAACRHQPGGALNCIHAVSDIAGFLPTHWLHGDAATRAVAAFYANAGKLKGPADEALYEQFLAQVAPPTPPAWSHAQALAGSRAHFRLLSRFRQWLTH